MMPEGNELLATLIKLLADQEGVKITYTLEEDKRKSVNQNDVVLQ